MTQEEWIKMRQQQDIPVVAFFEYYQEVGGYITDLTRFTEIWWNILAFPNRILPNRTYNINYATALDRLYKHFDNKFKITEDEQL